MFGKILDIIDKILTFFEEWTLFLTVMVALVALFINVVLRYSCNYYAFGIHFDMTWSEELVREVIIYTTFIGLAVAIKNRSMIKIDALVQLVPKLKIPLSYFSNLVTIIFAVMMIYYGWQMAALQVQTHQKTIIMEIPLVYLYAILPITGVTMLIRTIQVLFQDTVEQFSSQAGEK
jgi:C4-dicarboxylate transporter DctQ subunit